MADLTFTKMHGLGNDFVVLDARAAPLALTSAQVRAIADRRTGVGCDQLLVVEPPRNGTADAFLRIHNADGGEVAACGNGARCVAAMIMAEKGAESALIETKVGILEARAGAAGEISVDMGPASLEWRNIPLARDADTMHLGIEAGLLADPVAVSVGNPHAVFFVDDAEAVPLDVVGPEIEHHPLFPERTNVEAAQVISSRRVRLRVWERGVGITRACGSGACATLVAAHARGLTERAADIDLDGGTLKIELRKDDHVIMTGPAAVSFAGTFSGALLALEPGL
jgi:diaminopimelate epimerase